MNDEFVSKTQEMIRQTLDQYKTAEASPRVAQVWGCSNTGDFMCGFFVGQMVGSALCMFQVMHKRDAAPDEHVRIVDMIEAHSDEIKGFFSKFNKDST